MKNPCVVPYSPLRKNAGPLDMVWSNEGFAFHMMLWAWDPGPGAWGLESGAWAGAWGPGAFKSLGPGTCGLIWSLGPGVEPGTAPWSLICPGAWSLGPGVWGLETRSHTIYFSRGAAKFNAWLSGSRPQAPEQTQTLGPRASGIGH